MFLPKPATSRRAPFSPPLRKTRVRSPYCQVRSPDADERTLVASNAPLPAHRLRTRGTSRQGSSSPATHACRSARARPSGSPASPRATPGVDNFTPFAFGDFTWLNGTPRNKDTVLDTKFFTPEVRFDTHFMTDFNQPRDHTMGGATESVPVRRIPGRADQRRRRLPLAKRSRQNPHHDWPVCHHHAAQRRQRRRRPMGRPRMLTNMFRKPRADTTSTSTTG